MSDLAKPTAGARYLLERIAVEETRATYRVTIATPDAEFAGEALLDEDGSVKLSVLSGGDFGAPEPLAAKLAMFAKLTARGAAKRREDGLPAWPNRVLRWR